MQTLNLLAAVVGLLGAVAVIVGIRRSITDPRRIAAYAYTVLGAVAASSGIGIILYTQADQPLVLVVTVVIMVVLYAAGNIVGYPLLVGFLLWAGITNLRRESRSLHNMLALAAGIGLLLLPGTIGLLEPENVSSASLGDSIQYGLHLVLLLWVGYIALCFGAFVMASLAYRWRKPRQDPKAVVVLGSGLIGGNVPPLLAGRLQRGLKAVDEAASRPLLITSGGQGDDEPRSEGSAMRDYVLEQGFDPQRVTAEEASTSTRENLVFSQRLLPAQDAPITVVTSNYHVLRAALLTRQLGLNAHVVGAATAWYYLPGAVIREFIAIMREYVRFHVLTMLGLLAFGIVVTMWFLPLIGSPPV